MANLGGTFDANQYEPATGSPPAMPTDWYNVMMTDSEVRETKDKQGAYLFCTFKVLDGQYAGRLAWARLNLWNKNPVAVEIAQGELSAICHAVNVFQVQDTAVLHGKPLMARIVYKPAEAGYDEGNDVKAYAPLGSKESKNAGTPAGPGAEGPPAAAIPPTGYPATPPGGYGAPAPAPAPGPAPWGPPPGSTGSPPPGPAPSTTGSPPPTPAPAPTFTPPPMNPPAHPGTGGVKPPWAS